MSQWDDHSIISTLPLDTITVSRGKVVKAKCPNCSDYKQRLFFLWSDSDSITMVCCHRGSCTLGGSSLQNFVKRFYPDSYSEHYGKHVSRANLVNRSLKDIAKDQVKKQRFSLFKSREKPYGCVMLEHLHQNHKARKYIEGRKIPKSQWNSIYYCRSFKNTASHYGTNTSKWIDEDRLVIPFWDLNKDLTFLQGRSFDPYSKLRYITLKINENALKIWGLDTVNRKKKIYITEGPIDAMFLPNAISMGGADVSNKKLMEILELTDPAQLIFAYDNEPKSDGICKKMENKIKFGFSVVLWNHRTVKQKDINDMVLAGFDINIMKNMIFDGIRAKVRFKRWRRY